MWMKRKKKMSSLDAKPIGRPLCPWDPGTVSLGRPRSAGWWLVLICCERKILLASWWLVLNWCERKALPVGMPGRQQSSIHWQYSRLLVASRHWGLQRRSRPDHRSSSRTIRCCTMWKHIYGYTDLRSWTPKVNSC
jgi:hypothetical protein